ncbi:type VI secretion system Vgr family protein [Marinomonas gallaica]|uniref:type VI secretion system Vgr family protein n=1 Tax=Marinomonas gallaica TaxID=1806667 RepID=UPI003CE5B1EE
MADFSQKSRLLAIDSPLGPDALLLARLSGEERVSSLFGFEIEVYSLQKQISPDQIVGKNVTLKIVLVDDKGHYKPGSYRYINGYVQSFRQDGHILQGLQGYTATVVPKFWFLTQTSDCKIFHDSAAGKDIKQITDEVLKSNGFGGSDYRLSLTGDHPKREYTVQYKETDFNFLSRLFEEEGIFYYFEHKAGQHTLVISDNIGGYGQCEEASVDYRAGTASAHTIHTWNHRYEYRTGAYAHRDYNYRLNSPMKAHSAYSEKTETASMKVPGTDQYEHFVYPGRYVEKDNGIGDWGGSSQNWAKLRVEAEEAHHDIVHGESGCRSFTTGHKFTLKKHDDSPSEASDYMLLSVRHEAQDYSYTVGGTDDEKDQFYENHFECIPAKTVYRPLLVTGWPKMQGPQNAVVVGEPGEEIYTDKMGRVKVQFPWQRTAEDDSNFDDKSSCWVRVSSMWAGKNWGAIFLPRVGHEVIVDFIDGDPDRPLVTGSVYNVENVPPWTLPDNKTQSGILTRSSKDGTAENANWLRFEDKMGEEQIFVHAEKDLDTEVEYNETRWVGKDRSSEIAENDTLKVGKVLSIEAGDMIKLVCGGTMIKMESNGTITIEGSTNIKLSSPRIDLN